MSLIHALYEFVVRRPLLLLLVRQVTSHVDRWRRAVASQSRQGLTAWGKLEALASLAQYRFEQPDITFPEVVSSPPCYEATQLGHPLIPAARRVANDVVLNDLMRLLLVSGSNMSADEKLSRRDVNTMLGDLFVEPHAKSVEVIAGQSGNEDDVSLRFGFPDLPTG